MSDVQSLDVAIGTLVRLLTIDERRASSNLGPLPLNPIDLEVLSFIQRYPKAVAHDVAKFVGVGATTMQSAIDRLVRRGFIIRDKSALKGRAVALSLTQEGAQVRQQIHDQNLKNCERILACVKEEDQALFIRQLTIIADTFLIEAARE